MKNATILLILTILCFINTKASTQNETFTQWENMPIHFNPALTGGFEGILRLRTNHRNQWQSILGKNSFKTTAAAIDYKFGLADKRKFSVGFHTIIDSGGQSLSSESFNLSTSVVQTLGNPNSSHHAIALGFEAGMHNNKLDLDNVSWGGGPPIIEIFNSNIKFADISAGLTWQYLTKSHFSFQFGSAIHHLNRPNVSFSKENETKLSLLLNLHGNVEIPLSNRVSLVPSFLFSNFDTDEQFLVGVSNKWYFKSTDANFVQVGLFTKSTLNFDARAFNVYVISASIEVDSILLGFSFDHFQGINSNAYELSVGYTLGRANP